MQKMSAVTTDAELVDAALRGPSEVHVMPIADATGTTVALEALARYEAGRPDQVFAAATAAGRGTEAELAAARAAVGLLDRIDDDVKLSINVSATTLASMRLLALFAPVAHRLWVEVTEVEPVAGNRRAVAHANELRDAGATIVVDDAGAQHATAQQVILLAADVVKLDMALVRDVLTTGTRRQEYDELLDAARSLGAHVVAEGVEDDGDIAGITAQGADLLQGWAIGQPRAV